MSWSGSEQVVVPVASENGVGVAAVGWIGFATHETAGFQALDHVRQAGQGCVRQRGELTHATGVVGRLGKRCQRVVFDETQVRVPLELAFERPRQSEKNA